MSVVSQRFLSRYLAWFVCVLLSLGLQPGQLTRAFNAARLAQNLASQQSQGQSQGQSNNEEHHEHVVESLTGLSLRAHPGGPGPTRGWLVLRAALNAHPRAPEPLVAEDVRRVLLPRRAPPPEPDSHPHV
jgi:hypothetical protein